MSDSLFTPGMPGKPYTVPPVRVITRAEYKRHAANGDAGEVPFGPVNRGTVKAWRSTYPDWQGTYCGAWVERKAGAHLDRMRIYAPINVRD